MSGGTLICIPKQFFMVKPVVVHDDWDRFTLIAYVNEKGRQVLLGSVYMRPMFLKNEKAIDKQFDDLDNAIEQLLNTMRWDVVDTDMILGGDFNTNLDRIFSHGQFRNNKLEDHKVEALTRLLDKFSLNDSFRHIKNNKHFRDSPGYTYNPRRLTTNPSRIDFFFVSNSILNSCNELVVKTGPKSDINSDHEYIDMGIYTFKTKEIA